MSSSETGSTSASGTPGQPTQAPRRLRSSGSIAVTSPPGLRFHVVEPSGSFTKSMGSLLATTTKSEVPVTGFTGDRSSDWVAMTVSQGETYRVTRRPWLARYPASRAACGTRRHRSRTRRRRAEPDGQSRPSAARGRRSRLGRSWLAFTHSRRRDVSSPQEECTDRQTGLLWP
ncbi:Uncharacterised protein [Mycobacteroides abscessus subsp. massiliense]|nr:Uncharacterised protein [Mycobacteroides abscessus subsp. massiliense]